MSTARPSNLPPPGGPPRASDVRRRTVAPTTLQNLIAAAATKTYSELPSEEYLDKMEEELNRKVDLETEVLVEGMAEMVKISQIEGKDHFRVSQDAFQASCRTESMIRAAHSLLSLSHTLKLLHLFSDSATPMAVRERLSSELEAEIGLSKAVVHAWAS